MILDNKSSKSNNISIETDWDNFSKYVATFAENNENISEEGLIIYEDARKVKAENEINAKQIKESALEKIGIVISKDDVEGQEISSIKVESETISEEIHSIRSELEEMISELDMIRTARVSLQSRLKGFNI
jgi:hypothetical protein